MEVHEIVFYYDYGEEAIDEYILWLGCYRSLENAENSLSSYQKKKDLIYFPINTFI